MGIGRPVIVVTMLALCPPEALADDPKTYRLTVGDVAVDIDPGESLDVRLPDGSTTKVTLDLNAFATYSGDTFSYVYPTTVSITRTELAASIRQHLMASAVGTLVLIQEYGAVNPVSFDQLVLQELTRQTVQAGGELSQQPATRKLADGKELTGVKATLKTPAATVYFEVLGYGAADKGLLMMTRIDEANRGREALLVDTFWETLKIKL
jgi:hypothetical protein